MDPIDMGNIASVNQIEAIDGEQESKANENENENEVSLALHFFHLPDDFHIGQLNKAYKQNCLKYHPDKNRGHDTTDLMQQNIHHFAVLLKWLSLIHI